MNDIGSCLLTLYCVPGTVNAFYTASHQSNLYHNPLREGLLLPRFTDQEIEAYWHEGTSPRSQSCSKWHWDAEPHLPPTPAKSL